MNEIIISYNQDLYALIPNIGSQCWNMGTLESDTGSYCGRWLQLSAVDSDDNEYILCWFDESVEEYDDGIVDFDLYKPDIIQCTFYAEE